ncbi:MAG TPA: efflux RND transporter permease subunit [Terriglobia bacterium]|nr:efflux RND transporter permease subunit [Terriglobia bacterium]
MQKLAELCIRRPVFASMIVLSIVVVGATSYFQLDIDKHPDVDLPIVSVRTTLPGASPEEVEVSITQVVEEAVNTVEGIAELRSNSGQNTSNVIITFNLNRNIETATQDVRDKVGGILRNLPLDVLPPVIQKFNADQSPSVSIALISNRPIRELTELADKVIKQELERSPGVGEVRINGALERSVNIWVDPDRLAAYQMPITTVRDAIVRQNADVPGGNVTSGMNEQNMRTMGRMTKASDFNELVVTTINGSPVRIRDIGKAEDGTKEARSSSRLNGKQTVVLEIRRQSGANTVEVIDGIKKTLTQISSQLPRDVKLQILEDQSGFIYAALHEINTHLIVGSILASLVVFLFMRNWRAMVIAAVAIPSSLIAAFGMMWALHFTLNSVTMLALVLMVGIVIDDALVVLENTFRFMEEKKMAPFEATRAATADIGHAVLATTLSLVVIFVPVSFMSSIAGRFLYQFGITAAAAVLVSLIVSFTLTPMMCSRMLRVSDAGGEGHDARSRRGFYRWIDAGYMASLRFSMKHRYALALLGVVVMVLAFPMYRLIRQDYLPTNVDEGQFEVRVNAPEGVSLAAMDDLMRTIEAKMQAIPGVKLVLGNSGGDFNGAITQGRIYIQLMSHDERVFSWTRLLSGVVRLDPMEAFRHNYSQRDIMQIARREVSPYRDLKFQVINVQSINLAGAGGRTDIGFVVRGPEVEKLVEYGSALVKRGPELGLLDSQVSLGLNRPELRLQVDRQRAADLNADIQSIASAMRLMVGGDERVSRFHDEEVNEDYDVQLRLAEGSRNDLDTISRLYVPTKTGKLVRLDNLVRLQPTQSVSQINRLDRQRQVTMQASVAPGYGLADRNLALTEAARELNMPAGYSTIVTGRGRELERTFTEFLIAFALSVVFMYMILASLFESVSHPLTILLALPLAVPFALFSLWATGQTLNLYSALGMLVLFGVVKKNAILQIDHMNALRAAGYPKLEAILMGNRDRLRPILMTTMALVGGMLPLALGTGPGAEERRAVAVAVIGGQSLSLLLTLLMAPVAYSLIDDLTVWLRSNVKGPLAQRLPHRHSSGD